MEFFRLVLIYYFFSGGFEFEVLQVDRLLVAPEGKPRLADIRFMVTVLAGRVYK